MGCEIIAISVSVISLLFSFGIFLTNYSYEKKRMTLEAYKDLQKNIHFLYLYGDQEMEDFVTNYDSSEYKAISSSIAQIEIFAQGIKSQVYDFKLVYLLSHGFLDLSLREKIEYILDLKYARSRKEYYFATRWLLSEMDKKSGYR